MRRQSVADVEAHVKVAQLEVGDRKEGVLLVGKRAEGSFLRTDFVVVRARLGAPNQDADPEHDHAAKHNLEHRLQERRVHVAGADKGDRP